jgi:glycine hydroxymethyltransferase
VDGSGYAKRFFGVDLAELDPDIEYTIALEEERQARHIILIPSESMAPLAVRQALGSVFNNIYAEGYPPSRMCLDDEDLLLEFDHQLAYYRRYADRRFYKGVGYVHFIETLAQRRCARLFATSEVSTEQIYVNVQALSGAAANLAVYDAFMEPGDILMGLDLFQGGHLTHGSEFNISGRRYQVVPYRVETSTEQLDYDHILNLAKECRPKLIVAGYTSYPWAPDWRRFREIADAVGAYLLADIAHPAGMAAAGAYPNPVGLADVTTFTTHKTMCGPRGAVIMSTDPEKAALVDAAVFPGAQGGPHTNKFAAMAVAFKIATTEEFKALQHQIASNAQALGEALQKRGLKLAYGGTDTHLLMLDLRGMTGPHGQPLLGEIVVRVLELCGIVANKNTLPGDTATAVARGVRLGTPWVTQRGMGPTAMDRIADCIHRIVTAIEPFTYEGLIGTLPRGKLPLDVLESVKRKVAELADSVTAETHSRGSGYPHYYVMPKHDGSSSESLEGRCVLAIAGWRAQPFVQQAATNDVARLSVSEHHRSLLLSREGLVLDDVFVRRLVPDARGRDRFLMAVHNAQAERVKAWLRGLADGYLLFDPDDIFAKVEGPAVVIDLRTEAHGENYAELVEEAEDFLSLIKGDDDPLMPREELQRSYVGPTLQTGLTDDSPTGLDLYRLGNQNLFALHKTYFVGQKSLCSASPPAKKREWYWQEQEGPLKRSCLAEEHRKLTRHLVPFAGWEMPVRYASVSEEHQATRTAAALFDVSHMGVLGVSGPHATSFLDTVTTNYVRWLEDGQSHYSYLLDPDGNVIDDIIVYRRRANDYVVVVNAANWDKDWDWLNAVNREEVILDRENPFKSIERPAVLKNLKDPTLEGEQKVDVALQGPNSCVILQRLADDQETTDRLGRLARTALMDARVAGLEVVIARTGYTGEEVGYEIFVHPDEAPRLWNAILEAGADLGVKPAGLAARDSTRTEAGLPLYGHELAGTHNIDPAECGFASYVKLHKPFFVGRKAYMEKLRGTSMTVIRFRMDEKGVSPPRQGNPVVNRRGRCIGWVTSCAADSEGYLVGMAYVEKRYAEVGLSIGIFNLRRKPKAEVANIQLGDDVPLHNRATILPRFRRRQD